MENHKRLSIIFIIIFSLHFGSAQWNVQTTIPQNPIYQYQGQTLGSTFSIDLVGDLTGDNIQEILVGERGPLAPATIGSVKIINPVTGTIVHNFPGTITGGLFGSSVANLGDVSGNGNPDFVTGEINFGSGTVYVYDSSGSLVYTFTPIGTFSNFAGVFVANAGDVTADGKNDILVGSHYPPNVRLYNGATGTFIRTMNGATATSLGDITGDNVPDIATGYHGAGGTGNVWVYSGSNGQLLTTLSDNILNSYFGNCVKNGGDINGDGVNEIVVCADGDGNGSPSAPLLYKAYVFSGTTFSQIALLNGFALYDGFANTLTKGDFNRDGYSDLLVGAPGASVGTCTGRAELFKGPLLNNIYSWTCNPSLTPNGLFGYYDVFAGDINNDGFDELFIPYGNGPGFLIYAYGGVYSYGNGTLQLTWAPNPITPTTAGQGTVTITGAPPNAQGFILLSTAPANMVIFASEILLVNPITMATPMPITFDASGTFTLNNVAMLVPSLAGQNLYVQAVAQIPGSPYGQPSSYMLSNGLHAVPVA